MNPIIRNCKNCGEKYTPKYSTLEPCPNKECRLQLSKKSFKSKPKTGQSKQDLMQKFDYRNVKLSVLESKAKKEIQLWVRLRDRDRVCISCGKQFATEWHGGHFYKAEIYSGLIFEESNIHKQCRICNISKDGNFEGFKNGLIERYGEKYFRSLEIQSIEKRNRKWERDELIEIAAKYRRLNNQLKNT